MKKKLVEITLPIEVINKTSAREKSIPHGHPRMLCTSGVRGGVGGDLRADNGRRAIAARPLLTRTHGAQSRPS